jgi:hypothetical protein
MGMLNELLDTLGNSHFEAWIGSPLMGLIFGAILFGLGKSPDDKGKSESPTDVLREIKEYEERTEIHHHHHHYQQGGNDTEGSDLVVFALLALVFAIGLFFLTAYLPTVSNALHVFNAGTAVFCLTTVVLMVASGRYNSPQWLWRAAFPAAASILCFWFTIMARDSISPEVVTYAGGLMANESFSFSHVIKSTFALFKAVGSEYGLWMELVGAAFIFIAICSLILLLQCIHYVSLSNVRSGGTGVWMWLSVKTARFGSSASIVLATALLIISGLLASGTIYGWIHPAVAAS